MPKIGSILEQLEKRAAPGSLLIALPGDFAGPGDPIEEGALPSALSATGDHRGTGSVFVDRFRPAAGPEEILFHSSTTASQPAIRSVPPDDDLPYSSQQSFAAPTDIFANPDSELSFSLRVDLSTNLNPFQNTSAHDEDPGIIIASPAPSLVTPAGSGGGGGGGAGVAGVGGGGAAGTGIGTSDIGGAAAPDGFALAAGAAGTDAASAAGHAAASSAADGREDPSTGNGNAVAEGTAESAAAGASVSPETDAQASRSGGGLPGDMNLDQHVDFDDIPFFIQGLADPAAYTVEFGLSPTANGDGDSDGDLDFDDIQSFMRLLDSSDNGPEAPRDQTPAPSFSLGFLNGLSNWTAGQSGGSEAGQGTVTDEGTSVLLQEGDSFLVTLERTFEVPEAPTVLSFTYEDLAFDLSDNDSINDAFEVALVDPGGTPLVHPFVSGRDAFFNITEELPESVGRGITVDGPKITIDVSSLFAGTSPTIVFRLINNDEDEQSSVRITDVRLGEDVDLPPSITIGLLNDTAPDGPGSEPFRSDRLTNDPSVMGTAVDDQSISLLTVQVDSGPVEDITSSLSGGAYQFDPGMLPAGPHQFTLRATDTSGQSAEEVLEFVVNAPPTADAGGDRLASEGDTVVFDGSGSSDPIGEIFSHTWTFDDGSTAEGTSVFRTYPQDGGFAVTLTIVDSAGSVASETITVTVENAAPMEILVAALAGDEGQELSLTATFTDAGLLDTHTATITWGDGATSPGSISSGLEGIMTVTGSHVYADNGSYMVTVEVTDDRGAMGTGTAEASVSNVAPLVTPAMDQSVLVGETLDMELTEFSDPGFTSAAAGTAETFTVSVDWGDGSPAEAALLSASDGSPGVATTGVVRGAHAYESAGRFLVTVTVTDDDDDAGSGSFFVDVGDVNLPPSITIGLVNDTAPDAPGSEPFRSDRLTNEPSVMGTAVDDQPISLLTVQVDGGPVEDITSSLSGGAYQFDPGMLPAGPHQITLRATDTSGQSAEQMLDFVVNAPPTADASGDRLAAEGDTVIFDGSGSSDPIGEIVSHTWTFDDGSTAEGTSVFRTYPQDGGFAVTLTIVDSAGSVASETILVDVANLPAVVGALADRMVDEGSTFSLQADFQDAGVLDTHTATIDWGDGSLLENALVSELDGSGTLSGSHIYVNEGAYQVTVVVTDDDEVSLPMMFTADVRNVAPRDVLVAALAGDEGQELSLTATFTDAGLLDTHTATITWGDGATSPGSISSGLEGIMTVTGSHVYADNGSYMVTVEVTDDRGATGTGTAEASVSNVAPLVTPAMDQSVLVGETLDMELAEFSDPGFTSAAAGTAETFTVSVDWGDGSPAEAALLSVSDGSPGVATAGVVRGAHAYESAGRFLVTVTVTDDDADAGSGSFFVDVTTAGGTKFFVVDQSAHSTFRYDPQGLPLTESDLAHFNSRPRGIASNVAGDTYWVVDANKQVFVYNADGTLRGSWLAKSLNQPQDITTDGTDIWIVDDAKDRVYQYANAASRLSGQQSPSSSFNLVSANRKPTGLVTDGHLLWVSEDSPSGDRDDHDDDEHDDRYSVSGFRDHDVHDCHDDEVDDEHYKDVVYSSLDHTQDDHENDAYDDADDACRLGATVFVYSTAGVLGGSWELDPANGDPSGITLDPAGGTDLWVVDRHDSLVYHYADATGRRDGSQAASTTFPLDPNNHHAEGIADPPTLSIDDPSSIVGLPAGQTVVLTGQALDGTRPAYPVRINSRPADVIDADGNFFHHVLLAPGTNALNVEAVDAAGDTTTSTVTIQGRQLADGAIDFERLSVVSGSALQLYGRTSWNDAGSVLHADFGVTNIGQYAVDGPVLVGITNISDPMVRLQEPNGSTPDGIPYFDISSLVSGGILQPGDASGLKSISFFAPERTRFSYDVVFFARVNEAPRITTVPDVDVLAGSAYEYDVDAADPNNDVLTYSLVSSPNEMAVAPDTGRITWDTSAADKGTHTVIVQVDDGRGGSTQQRYVISVSDPPPNRPPVFVSIPLVAAAVNTQYHYKAKASDADPDPLTFSQVSGPDGMAVDSSSGDVTWTPADNQVGTQEVVLEVSDGRGGKATQSFTIRLGQEPGNTPPVIISQPILGFDVPRLPNPATGDVTPIHLDLDLGPGESSTQTVSLTLPALDAGQNFADIMFVVDETITMAGDHDWLEAMIPQLDAALEARGIGPNRYILVGFGDFIVQDVTRLGHPHNLLSGLNLTMFGPTSIASLGSQTLGPLVPLAAFEVTATTTGPQVVSLSDTTNIPGAYRFHVLRPAVTTVPLTLGSLTSGSIDVPSERDSYTFTVTEPSQVYFDSLTNDSRIKWSLNGPSGTLVNNLTFTATDGRFAQGSPALSLVPGDYTLTVSADTSVLAPYQFRLSDLATATPLVPGTAVTVVRDPANETHLYQFHAAAGDRFYFDLVAGTAIDDPFWRLADPFGNLLFKREFRFTDSGDADVLTLTQPGAYTLFIEGGVADTAANTSTFNVQPAPISTSSMMLGDVVTGDIATAGDQDRHTFSLASAALINFDSLTNNGNLRWTLTGPAGTLVSDRSLSASDGLGIPNPILSLVAGDYTLTVDGFSQSTGVYSFRLSDLATAPVLVPGTPVSGNLDPANETDLFHFTAAAGDRFSFDVQARTNGGGARWRLVGPYGNILFSNNFNDTTNSDVAAQTLLQPGDYTLLLEGAVSDTVSGSYTFVVVPEGNSPPPPPPPSTPLALGTTASDAISAAGEQDHYSFNLANASLLYFDALTNNGTLNWTLAGPAGTVVSARSFTASDAGNLSGSPAMNLVAGDYILTVGASGASTGSYSFRLSELSQAVPLSPGTPVSGEWIPGNETDLYQFTAAAGDRFYFDVLASSAQGFFSARWQLLDPYGSVVFNNFFGNSPTFEADLPTLSQPGTYTLLIEGHIASSATGTYAFNVQPVTIMTTPLTLGESVNSAISVQGERDIYTFNLPGATKLYFDSHTNNGNLTWTLNGPAGVTSRTLANDAGLTNSVLNVPAGDYTLTIDGAGDLGGVYGFRLSDLSAAAPLTPGTPVSGQLSPGNETDLYQFSAAAGDRFFFDVQARPSSGFSRWQLFDPYGNSLFNNVFVDTSVSDVDVRTLTQPGTYTLLLEGGISETAVGPYTINVQPITTTTTPLTLGELVDSAIAVQGEQDQYTFTLPAEARLVFDSLTNNGTLNWTLTGPTGPVVSGRPFNVSDGINAANPVVNVPAGQYTLTIDGVGELGGVYSFRLSDLAAATLLTPGTPVSGTLSPANETDIYRFDVTAGDRFYFDAQARSGAPSARWRLINPFGAVRFSSEFGSPSSDVGDIVLGSTGTFLLLIEGAIGDATPGTYTFNVAPSPINITPLALGDLISGAIAAKGEQDRYTFSLATPSLLYFDSQINGSGLVWTLAGPAGTAVSARSLSEVEINNPPLSLPAGDYSLTIHAPIDVASTYTFRLSELSSATMLTPGTPVTGELSTGNESDILSFMAAAGDLFSFDVQARTGQGASWRLVGPLGDTVFNQPFDSASNFVDTLSVSLSGRYTLVVAGAIGATATGTYTFNVQPVTIVTQPLTLGSTVTDSISVLGELDRHTFTLPAASFVYFDALANNSSVVWTLAGPAGTPVSNRSFTTTDATPILNLPAGDYTVTVDGFGKGTGPYSFRVSELSSATALTPGTPTSGSLDPPNETDLFRFTAVANERYSFDVQDTNGRISRYRLIDPLGSVIFNSGFGDVGATTLALSGPYTLLLEGAIGETISGTYTFAVVSEGTATPPPPPPSTPIAVGPIVSDSISAAGELDRYTFTLPSAAVVFFDSLTSNGNLNWSLAGPAGTVVSNRGFTSSDAINGNPVTGLFAGDYTLTVAGNGANTGDYSFRLLDSSLATPITPGTAFGGSFDPANETDLYRFSASAGDRFFFDTTAWTNPGNARWRLVDPYGNILFDFFAGGDVDVITAAQPGVYALLLEAAVINTVVGTYTINVRPVPISTTPLTIGNVTSGDLATPGEQDRYTFSLANASLLYFDSLTSNANLSWNLVGPGGINVSRNFSSSDAVNVGANPVLSLPAGDYALTIDGNADSTGGYAFRLNNLSAATLITPRTPISGSLDPGNETDLYRFTASAGEQFYIDALAVGGPGGRWRLVDPFGNHVFSNVFGSVSTIESDVLTLQAGNYTLLVEGHVVNTATTSYTINVQPVAFSTQPVSFGQPVNAALSIPGEQDNYTFNGVTGQRVYFDRLGPAAQITANLFAPSGTLVFSSASTPNVGPFFLPETGTYRLNFDATGDVFGGYGFQLHDVASMPTPDANGDIAGVLDQHLGSDLFVVDAAAGQTLVFSPAVDLFVGTAEQVSVATRSLLVFGNIEDGYEAIDSGLRLDAFRDGAAVNVVLVTDENRDVLDPNLTFASTFTTLDNLNAKINGVHEATFHDGLGRTALGVDSQGTAYLADGAGGFIAAPGGVFVTGRESTKADYIDLEWALGGAAWDTAQLRGGGLPAVSFTKAFVEIKAREIAEQLGLDVVASDPNANFQNLTDVRSDVGPGEAAGFDVTITGDGNPQSFDLLFVRPGTNVILGSIPVTINADDYTYPVQALDADGDPITFRLVESPFGAAIDASNGRISWTPAAAGDYRFVVEADDGRGGRDVQEYEVTVTSGAPNQSPTITSTAPQEATEELPFGYAVTATDPDGDLLTYFLTQAPAGMAIDATTGLVTWTPTLQQIGPHEVTVRVVDGRGGETTQSFTLSVVADTGNRAPQILSTPLTDAFSGELYRYDVAATDADGDALVFDLVVKPTGMTIDQTSGEIAWRPTREHVGRQHAIVRVRDGRGGVDLESYDVLVGGPGTAPLILPPPPSAPAVAFVPYEHRFHAQDADGDALTFQLTAAADGMTIDPDTGVLSWTPTGAQVRAHVVIVSVVDTAGLRNSMEFVLTVVATAPNIAPLIRSAPRTQTQLGTRYLYSVDVFDENNDHVALTLPVAPAGMTLDPERRVIEWVPAPDQLGDNTVEIHAADGRGGSDVQSFVIRVAATVDNEVPRILSTPVVTATAERQYDYNLLAEDPDGDSLVWSLETAPRGMSIHPILGTVRWTPAADQTGPADVVVLVSDAQGGRATQSFTINVRATNSAPIITSAPPTEGNIGQIYRYAVTAADPDGDPLPVLEFLDGTLDPASQVSWWRADGSTTDDRSDNDGTLQSGATFDTGKFGLAFNFDGINDHVVVPDHDNLRPAEFSLEAWIKPSSTTFFDTVIAKGASGLTPGYHGDANAFWLGLADGIPRMYTGHFTTLDNFITGDAALTPNEWHHIAGSFDGTTKSLYADGVLVASATVASPLRYDNVAVPLTIGDDWVNGAASGLYQFDGQIDEPAIYNRALTDGEIQAIFHADLPGKISGEPPAGIRLTTFPAGMSIDAASGQIQWTPAPTQVGSHSVVVDVSDGYGDNARQSYTVVVGAAPVNLPPTIMTSPTFVASAGLAYTYDADASDPEGDALTFELLVSPTGMTIDPSTGLINWVPTESQVDNHRVTLAVADALGNRTSLSYRMVVLPANRPPTINSTAVTSATAGVVYRYDVQAGDPDGNALNYVLTTAPAGMAIDALGRITWATAVGDIGTHSVAVKVTDTFGASAIQDFALRVEADTQPPAVVVELSTTLADVGTDVMVFVFATDNVGIAELVLTADGSPLPLDVDGMATLRADQVGTVVLAARATDPGGNVATAENTLFVIDPTDADAPFVQLTSPAFGAVVTAPTEVIGTVTDDNLLFYTLSVAPLGSEAFIEFARGTGIVNDDVLGVLDPTLLQNDSYVLRLEATDAGGNIVRLEQEMQVAGDLKLGNFTLSFTDLEIPVTGIPITVTRTYDTLQANRQDDLGFGWRIDFRDVDLRTSVLRNPMEQFGFFNPFRDNTRVYLTLPGGRREGFTFEPKLNRLTEMLLSLCGGGFCLPEESWQYDPIFVPDAGVTSQLTLTGATTMFRNNRGEYFGLVGGRTPFNPANPIYVSTYAVTTEEGLVFKIDASTGELDSVRDPNGNTLVFSDGGITSSTGTQVVIGRDPQGRITDITDPSGAAVRYEYDVRGDLVAVSDREDNTTRFVYRTNPAHYLEQVIDPLGRTGARSEYDAQGRLVGLIDAGGNSVRFEYDPANSLETIRDQLGNPTTYEYDDRGNIITQVDALGGVTRRVYDDENNMLSETDPLGRTRTLTYDDLGNVLTETDPLGNTTISTYQVFTIDTVELALAAQTAAPFTRPKTLTDPLGNTTANSYDSFGNLTSHTNPLGHTTTMLYDTAGNPTVITDPLGHARHNNYDGTGNRTQLIDANGHAVNLTYDANGNPLSQTEPSGGGWSLSYNAEGLPTGVGLIGLPLTAQYDALQQITQLTYPSGQPTTLTYDALGNVTQFTFPDGAIAATNTYDAVGNLVAVTDSLGNVTRYAYDAVNQLVQTTHPDGSVEEGTYNLAGELEELTDPVGNKTRYVYDGAGREIQVIDALGGITGTQYDAVGRIVAVTDPLGRTTRFQYDANGQQIATVAPDGSTTRNVYDAAGRLVQTIDAEGDVTTNAYDPDGNLLSVTDALGNVTRYQYGASNERLAIIDANGHITRFRYDTQGRIVETTYPDGETDSSTYDSAGRLASTTDGNGQTIRYGYDIHGRLITRTLPDSSLETYTYTSDGLISSFTDARGATRYDYDPLMRRLIRVTEPDGARISYGYDATGNRILMTSTVGATSLNTSFTFDTLNRLETVTDPDLGVTLYTYDAASNLIRTELPNGTVETRSYDDLNRLLFRENLGPSGVISSQLYTLNANGYRSSEVDQDGRRVDYTYDDLDRLTREQITDVIFGDRTFDYTYDAVGNRLSRNDSAEGLTQYSYDANDRLLTEALAGDLTQYTYDDNGNMLSRESATDRAFYNWDVLNRLISADTDGDGTIDVQNKYDHNGIRVSQTVEGQETRFLIDTVQPFAQVLLEYRPSGLIVASYVHGHGLISQSQGGARGFYHADGLGSTRALTDATGAVLNRYVYDAFGRTLHQTGSTANPYQFAGQQRDAALGLDYLRARYYDPATGRFISRDAFPGSAVLPHSLNKYLYALANPVNHTDPSGNTTLLEIDFVQLIQSVLNKIETSRKTYDRFQTKNRFEQKIGGFLTVATAGLALFDPERLGGFFGSFFTQSVGLAPVLAVPAGRWLGQAGYRMLKSRTTYILDVTTSHLAYVRPTTHPDTVWVSLDYEFETLPLPRPGSPFEDSQIFTLVHEFHHLVSKSGITDYRYGVDALFLNPSQALCNAYNYEIAVNATSFGLSVEKAFKFADSFGKKSVTDKTPGAKACF